MYTEIERIGELSSDGVFIYNLAEERIVYLNDRFAEMAALDKENIRADYHSLIALIQSEDSFYTQRCYRELLEQQTVNCVEFRIKAGDDTLRHVSCHAYILSDGKSIAGFVQDITLDRQHNDYIINYGAKKDTLLDMMTHNLSGPLALSQNIINWMQDHSKDRIPPEVWSQINFIKANTQECLDIINDFLKEEHLVSEHIFVKKTRFDVLQRITETLDKLIESNKNKNIRLITKLENLNINTDSVKFFQVVHNLVSNAIKFTPEDGNIDLIVEEREATFVVRVKDDGIGIPDELHPVLFEKRTPAKREGLNKETSTGLGLSIVKNLVTLMGGTITFTSQVNEGSEFVVELPKV